MVSKLVILAAMCLFLGVACYGSPTDGICGIYFKNDEKNPFAGALVALYDAGNNSLIDFTYTTNDGRFTLKAPQQSGKYYIVATKGDFTQRQDIDYNLQNPNHNLLIAFQLQENSLSRALAFLGNAINDIYKVILGLILGLWFRRGEEKSKAAEDLDRNFGPATVLLDIIREDNHTLTSNMLKLAAMTGPEKDRAETECGAIVERIETNLTEFQQRLSDKKDDIEKDISKLYGTNGLRKFYSTEKALRDLSDFITRFDDIKAQSAKQMQEQFKGFQAELKNKSFIETGYSWRTRIKSAFNRIARKELQ